MNTDKMLNVVIFVLIAVALLPSIATTITSTQGNFSGATLAMFVLIPLFVVWGIIKNVKKASGGRA